MRILHRFVLQADGGGIPPPLFGELGATNLGRLEHDIHQKHIDRSYH